MANDFFSDLGKTISKTAQGIGERVNTMYEVQKAQSKVSAEEKKILKLKGEIGQIIFDRFQEGVLPDEDIKAICEDIIKHMNMIESLKENAANRQGKKICPGCKKTVDKQVSFCPYCGAPCPDPDPQEVEDDFLEDDDDLFDEENDLAKDEEAAAEDIVEGESRSIDNLAEEAGEAAEVLEDAAEDLAGEAAKALEDAADAADDLAAEAAEKAAETADTIGEAIKDAFETEE